MRIFVVLASGLLVAATLDSNIVHAQLPAPPVPNSASPRIDGSSRSIEESDRRAMILRKIQDLAAAVKRADMVQLRGADGATEAPALPAVSAEQASRELDSWKRALDQYDLESICGPIDNSVDVERYTGNMGATRVFVDRYQSAVMQLQWRSDLQSLLGPKGNAGDVSGQRWCTGTMVSDNIMLTAGHCFDIDGNGWTTPRKNDVALTPFEMAPLFQLNFNYQYPPTGTAVRPEVVYPVVKLLEHRLGGSLDFAFVEVGRGQDGQLPSARFGKTVMDASDTGLVGATMLTVIQHPDGKPKKVAGGTRKSNISLPFLLYSDVDTLGGSSGSGVLDHRGMLIAVHTNGGCTNSGGNNKGVALKAIKPFSPTLQKLAP